MAGSRDLASLACITRREDAKVPNLPPKQLKMHFAGQLRQGLILHGQCTTPRTPLAQWSEAIQPAPIFLMCDRLHAFLITQWHTTFKLISSYGSRVIHTTILSSVYARIPLQKILLGDNHTPQDIANLLIEAHRVVVITEAGISTSCGIPDFRSKAASTNLIANKALLPPPSSTPSTPSDSTLPSSQASISSQQSLPASRL